MATTLCSRITTSCRRLRMDIWFSRSGFGVKKRPRYHFVCDPANWFASTTSASKPIPWVRSMGRWETLWMTRPMSKSWTIVILLLNVFYSDALLGCSNSSHVTTPTTLKRSCRRMPNLGHHRPLHHRLHHHLLLFPKRSVCRLSHRPPHQAYHLRLCCQLHRLSP